MNIVFLTYRRLCELNGKDYREKMKNCKGRKRHYNYVKVNNFGIIDHRCRSTGEARLLCHVNSGVVKLQACSQHICPFRIYLWHQQEISTHIILHHLP
jgi:hypothetical protein